MIDLDKLLSTAILAGRAAGKIQIEKFGTLLNVDEHFRNDIKLETDRLCELSILSCIKSIYPDHSFFAEESGKSSGSDYTWYIDPLDGTVNFYYGLPYFCTSIACYHSSSLFSSDNNPPISSLGEPLVAVIYAPYTNELFTAAAGRGCYLNNKEVKVRGDLSLSDSLILTTMGLVDGDIIRTRDYTVPLAQKVKKLRNMGAAAYDLANVAAGRASGFFERGIKVWDWAAGNLLIKEAGGIVSGWLYEPSSGSWAISASCPSIHNDLLPLIAN